MSYRTQALFAIVGAVVWGAATLFYAAFGAGMIERAFWFYALNAAITAAVMTVIFRGLARAAHIGRANWLVASLAFAGPGVLLALAMAPGIAGLFPHAAPESVGRYGAYLFFAYTAVFAMAISPQPALQQV